MDGPYYDRYKVTGPPLSTVLTSTLNNGGPWVASQLLQDVFVRYRFGPVAKQEGRARHWLTDRTEVLLGVRNIMDREPAFDGSSLTAFFMSPYGDVRLRSYWISVKRGF